MWQGLAITTVPLAQRVVSLTLDQFDPRHRYMYIDVCIIILFIKQEYKGPEYPSPTHTYTCVCTHI